MYDDFYYFLEYVVERVLTEVDCRSWFWMCGNRREGRRAQADPLRGLFEPRSAECHACKASAMSMHRCARCSDVCGDSNPLDMADAVADIVRSVLMCSETVWTAVSSCDPTTH
jgi:hypothetical protein